MLVTSTEGYYMHNNEVLADLITKINTSFKVVASPYRLKFGLSNNQNNS